MFTQSLFYSLGQENLNNLNVTSVTNSVVYFQEKTQYQHNIQKKGEERMEHVVKVKAYQVIKTMEQTNQIRIFYAHDHLKRSFKEFKLRVLELFGYLDNSNIEISWKGR